MPPSRLSVFLCHAAGDKAAVRHLYQRLLRDGFKPWLDEEDLLPGQEWGLEIPNAVRTSDVVVVCLSRLAVSKEGYVQKEIKFALDIASEKPEGTTFLIPLKLEECPVPQRLSQWQWVLLDKSSGGYEKLVFALRSRAEALGRQVSLSGEGASEKELALHAELEKLAGLGKHEQVTAVQAALQTELEELAALAKRKKEAAFQAELKKLAALGEREREAARLAEFERLAALGKNEREAALQLELEKLEALESREKQAAVNSALRAEFEKLAALGTHHKEAALQATLQAAIEKVVAFEKQGLLGKETALAKQRDLKDFARETNPDIFYEVYGKYEPCINCRGTWQHGGFSNVRMPWEGGE